MVTQRITKYPVLFQRILDNTKGEPDNLWDSSTTQSRATSHTSSLPPLDNEEEAQSFVQTLVAVKELLSSINQQVAT